jgi:hypothetical protein
VDDQTVLFGMIIFPFEVPSWLSGQMLSCLYTGTERQCGVETNE